MRPCLATCTPSSVYLLELCALGDSSSFSVGLSATVGSYYDLSLDLILALNLLTLLLQGLEIEAPISPVPIPHIILRPMTREMTRLSLQDKHNRILRGNLNIQCPHDSKVARLYISNTGIGEYSVLG